MSQGVYEDVLKNSLLEIKRLCPGVTNSFIFTKEGKIVVQDVEIADADMGKIARLFNGIVESAEAMGGVDSLQIEGEEGDIQISSSKNVYFGVVSTKDVDKKYLRSATNVIIPTIMKLLQDLLPTPLKLMPSRQLTVKLLGRFKGMFAGNIVQADPDLIKQWSTQLGGDEVQEIEIETENGKLARCKLKAIDDMTLTGKRWIVMPEKILQTLEVKDGESIRAKPIPSQSSASYEAFLDRANRAASLDS